MYYYGNNPSQTTADEEQFKKTVAIALPVFILVVLLLRLPCFWIHKDNDEEDVVAGPGNRVRQQRSWRLGRQGTIIDGIRRGRGGGVAGAGGRTTAGVHVQEGGRVA